MFNWILKKLADRKHRKAKKRALKRGFDEVRRSTPYIPHDYDWDKHKAAEDVRRWIDTERTSPHIPENTDWGKIADMYDDWGKKQDRAYDKIVDSQPETPSFTTDSSPRNSYDSGPSFGGVRDSYSSSPSSSSDSFSSD